MAVLHSLAAQPAATAPASTASAAPSPKLVHAAHEFEAQMMKELLEPMTASDPLFGNQDEDADDAGGSSLGLDSGSGSGGALADFATESLGQALSEHGGFGIADKIIRQLTPASNREKSKNLTTEVTSLSHRNTVMRKGQ
jgi:Rod binding domain-containing protein